MPNAFVAATTRALPEVKASCASARSERPAWYATQACPAAVSAAAVSSVALRVPQ